MKIFLHSVLAAVLLLSSGPRHVSAQSKELTSEEATVQLLIKDLATLIKTPGKSFRLFHYNPTSTMNLSATGPLHDSQALDYIRTKSDRFWRKNESSGRGGNMFGDGFYLASDPVVTMSFGQDTQFSLLELDLDANSVILDVATTQNEMTFSPKTLAILKRNGCILEPIIDLSILSTASTCQKFFNAAYRSLGVQLIAYKYEGSKLKDCDSKDIAFEMIDSRSIKAAHVAHLSGTMDFKNPAALHEAQMIYSLTAEVDANEQDRNVEEYLSHWTKNPAISGFLKKPGSKNEIKAWKKKYLPFCDPERKFKIGKSTIIEDVERESARQSTPKDFKDQPDALVIQQALKQVSTFVGNLHALT